MNLVHQAFDYFELIGQTILREIVFILLFLFPVVLLIIFRKKISSPVAKGRKKYFLIAVCFHLIALALFLPGRDKLYSSYQLYWQVDSQVQIVDRFGLLTGTRIDLKRLIIRPEETLIQYSRNDSVAVVNYPEEVKFNIKDIDFEYLINNTTNTNIIQMHEYFMNEQPTKQNEFTGLFEGKNLIFIIAEGFNQIAVREDITPTLYKLSNESFVFENFYTPIMFSTIGGEMQALMGLIPFQDTINLWRSNRPIFPYAIGNSFSLHGYNTRAFHNWSYTYYGRNTTFPTLGFSNFVGCRNGLERLMNCNHWPPSDVELIEAIAPNIIGTGEKQATYILTVSGHSGYSWSGNAMSRKNRDIVRHLPYSEDLKGYLASQVELDRALELLIEKLEEAGELENTVIALVGDHYPFSFSINQINELSTFGRDRAIEVNRSNFILWNPTVPRTEISKIGSQIDVLPTLLNLFGVPYDSRLIVGNDILSDTPGLAMFSDRSWVSDFGVFTGGTFTPFPGIVVEDDYAEIMNKTVANKFSISRLIIQHDYYRKIFNN